MVLKNLKIKTPTQTYKGMLNRNKFAAADIQYVQFAIAHIKPGAMQIQFAICAGRFDPWKTHQVPQR
jgi:hypothetical protein